MYANSRNMSKQCIRVLSLFSKNSNQVKKTFTATYFPSRNLNIWPNFSRVLLKAKDGKVQSSVKKTDVPQQQNKSEDGYESDSNQDEKEKKETCLMEFQPVIRPEIFLTIKNWIIVKFILQPYLDRDFTLKEFTLGSKQAIEVVSSLLSQGDLNSLKGLVSDDAIEEIKKNIVSFNLKERQDLLVKAKDVIFAFPYQIGICFDDDNQKRFAEITVVYHCMNDLEEFKSQGKMISGASHEDIKICNYRFIRDYTKGVSSEWTINRLGHYKLRHFDQ